MQQEAVHQAVLIALCGPPIFSTVGESGGLSNSTTTNSDTSDQPYGGVSSSSQSNSLQLVAGKVSGREQIVKTFQKRLLTFCVQSGGEEQRKATQQPGIVGQVGVLNGKSIQL